MTTRENLRRAQPTVNSATIRFVRGEINRAEYERQVAEERRLERRPVGDRQAASGG